MATFSSAVQCFCSLFIRSLRYLNGRTLPPFPAEAGHRCTPKIAKPTVVSLFIRDLLSALAVLSRQVVRVDGFAAFDVAFDINAAGNAVITPVKLVVVSPGGSRPVGLLRVPGTFETALEAPKTGYEADSSFVLTAGEVVMVQSAHNTAGDLCQFAINPNIYAKITVDSLNLASRTIFFRLGLDPNCGFRSFVTGVPTS